MLKAIAAITAVPRIPGSISSDGCLATARMSNRRNGADIKSETERRNRPVKVFSAPNQNIIPEDSSIKSVMYATDRRVSVTTVNA